MRQSERSIGALLLGLIALGFIAAALTAPWYHYEQTSGRLTPPGGPQGEENTGEEHYEIDFYAGSREGDMDPSDPALADKGQDAIKLGLYIAAGALVLLVLGEIPGISLIIVRPIGVALAVVAMGGLGYSLWAAWFWLPASLAAYGVDDPYTAKLLENGYIRSNLLIGIAYAAIAFGTAFAAGVWKFGAGDARPAVVEMYRSTDES